MPMQVQFTKSARKHRLGTGRVLQVIEGVEPTVQPDARGDRLLWIGRDSRGLEIEVVGLMLSDVLLIIHAMPSEFRKRRRELG